MFEPAQAPPAAPSGAAPPATAAPAAAPPRGLPVALQLLLCGAAALYWELALIRWLGSCVRIVAYYANFVLIAAFFGLGTGALLARRGRSLQRFVFPVLAAAVLVGYFLAGFWHHNPAAPAESIWIGAPPGLLLDGDAPLAAAWLLLLAVYLVTALVFVVFGGWIGALFGELPPLRAYSLELGGSLLGVLLFAALSFAGAGPTAWFAVGFALVLLVVEPRPARYAVAAASCALVFALVSPFAARFVWSPYYRIFAQPVTRVADLAQRRVIELERPLGHAITVNSDYHQLLLDLRPRAAEPAFVRSWRWLYEAPYRDLWRIPPGPILVLGAGAGNDVAAALRRTDRRIVAVEIDPALADLGRRLHPERPYADPRVQLVIADARSFVQRTRERFALVIFGFLDSHTLASRHATVRLDNFVYTLEAMEHVNRALVPAGKVALTFAPGNWWLNNRMQALLLPAFGGARAMSEPARVSYVNGVLYEAYRAPWPRGLAMHRSNSGRDPDVELAPTDDWPFLYLQYPHLPAHYRPFLAGVVLLGLLPLLLLPRAERRLRWPYFLLGLGFFLVETGNILGLSLLFGSTWVVNALVFGGVLLLVLLGNATVHLWRRRTLLWPAMGALLASLALAYATPVSALLAVEPAALRLAAAVGVFLGPVYFASVVFATLVRDERNLAQAYGSNLLGAVLGGACEYLALLIGFKALQGVVIAVYVAVVWAVVRARRGA